MSKSETFDYKSHNQKISKIRGQEWKEKLRLKKLEASSEPTVLRYERIKAGLSQASLMNKVDIKTQTTMALIERGKQLATRQRAEKIANVLDVPITRLFVEVEDLARGRKIKKYLAI